MSVLKAETPPLETPKWLEELENKRKRPHKLAHEIGAGAPCLICKDRCIGLNLHFWRKLCIECKCRKEDHEVQEEDDYSQFEILFGAKKVKQTTLKFGAQTKSFDWVPPNVSPDLVVDYLKSIPLSKLPISNSEGARYRKQQLEKQVPLHDVDPNACHNISAQETEEFNKYVNNLKNNVIGQGKIIKYQSPQKIKETYVYDILPKMMASSQDYGSIKPQGGELRGCLTIDKSFHDKAHSELAHTNPHLVTSSSNFTTKTKCFPLRIQTKNATAENPNEALEHSMPNNKGIDSIFQEFSNSMNKSANNESTQAEIFKFDRQNNNETNQKEEDDNCNERKKNDLVGGVASEKNDFLLERNNLKTKKVDSVVCRNPLEKLKELQVSSTDVPFVPVQEVRNISSQKNRGNTKKIEEETPELNCFPSPPATCQQCLSILNPEEIVIETDRGGTTALWHAQCFVCDTCKELLVDLMYFFDKGKVFCGRHYAEMKNIPRCYACDELIFTKEYTCAEGVSYHIRHFCCFHCDEPLAGKQYIPKDSNPICLDCYQKKYGKKCQTCCRPILPGEQRISWQHLDFHVSADCFRCTNCKNSLLGGKFVVKNDHVFCSKNCVLQYVQ